METWKSKLGKNIPFGQMDIFPVEQELSKLTPVEIVGYEVWEAGNPLALDNG